MEDLPDDVLALVFLASPPTPKDKLSICAVSRRLRRAALDTLLLWSSIEICSSTDLLYLDTFLERSRDALLDVSIHPFGFQLVRPPSSNQFDTGKLVATLLAHITRLRSLEVYLYDPSILSPLLCEDLLLEHLQKLVVHGGINPAGEIVISLSAPQLHSLDLCFVSLRNLAVLAPCAMNLTVVLAFSANLQAFMDELAANWAHSLCSLRLMQTHPCPPLLGPWVLLRLQVLDLGLGLVQAVELLRGMNTAHIPYVHVSLIDYQPDYRTVVYPVLTHLLLGTEKIVSFSMQDVNACTTISRSGQQRTLRVLSSREPELQRHIWDYLCDHLGASTSISSSDLDTGMWYLYQSVFAERAPAGPEFTLRITPCFMSNELRPLNFPTLSKVVLMGNGTGSTCLQKSVLDLADYQRAVPWLARGALQWFQTEVALCTCGISQANECETRTSLREWIREELQPEGSLSAEARCVIQWVLCSGNCMSPR